MRSSFLRVSARYSSLILGSHPTTSRRRTKNLHEPHVHSRLRVCTVLIGMLIRIATTTIRAAKKTETEGGSVACRPALVYSTAQNRAQNNKQRRHLHFLSRQIVLQYSARWRKRDHVSRHHSISLLLIFDALRRIGRPGWIPILFKLLYCEAVTTRPVNPMRWMVHRSLF